MLRTTPPPPEPLDLGIVIDDPGVTSTPNRPYGLPSQEPEEQPGRPLREWSREAMEGDETGATNVGLDPRLPPAQDPDVRPALEKWRAAQQQVAEIRHQYAAWGDVQRWEAQIQAGHTLNGPEQDRYAQLLQLWGPPPPTGVGQPPLATQAAAAAQQARDAETLAKREYQFEFFHANRDTLEEYTAQLQAVQALVVGLPEQYTARWAQVNWHDPAAAAAAFEEDEFWRPLEAVADAKGRLSEGALEFYLLAAQNAALLSYALQRRRLQEAYQAARQHQRRDDARTAQRELSALDQQIEAQRALHAANGHDPMAMLEAWLRFNNRYDERFVPRQNGRLDAMLEQHQYWNRQVEKWPAWLNWLKPLVRRRNIQGATPRAEVPMPKDSPRWWPSWLPWSAAKFSWSVVASFAVLFTVANLDNDFRDWSRSLDILERDLGPNQFDRVIARLLPEWERDDTVDTFVRVSGQRSEGVENREEVLLSDLLDLGEDEPQLPPLLPSPTPDDDDDQTPRPPPATPIPPPDTRPAIPTPVVSTTGQTTRGELPPLDSSARGPCDPLDQVYPLWDRQTPQASIKTQNAGAFGRWQQACQTQVDLEWQRTAAEPPVELRDPGRLCLTTQGCRLSQLHAELADLELIGFTMATDKETKQRCQTDALGVETCHTTTTYTGSCQRHAERVEAGFGSLQLELSRDSQEWYKRELARRFPGARVRLPAFDLTLEPRQGRYSSFWKPADGGHFEAQLQAHWPGPQGQAAACREVEPDAVRVALAICRPSQ